MPNFTRDWFSEAIGIFDFYLKDFKGRDNLNFCEIGSFEGRSALWFLENILTGKNSTILCVDSFGGSDRLNALKIDIRGAEQRIKENLQPYVGKFRIMKGLSQVILRNPEFINKFDVIYVDGSHEGSDTLEDMVISYRNLKEGGLMFMDDYLWNSNAKPLQNTPKMAIDSFTNCFKDKMKIKEFTYKTVILEKII